MPLTNLNNDHFTQAEKDIINKSWDTIMTVLIAKSRNLTPEERKKFGSVAEQNKLVVLKTLEYHSNQAHLDCPDVDYPEQIADWDDRVFVAGFISKMAEAGNICNNIRITHDYDAFQASRADYEYTKYKMNQAPGAGWESKYDDLLPFFTTNDGSGGDKKDNTPDA